MMRAIHNLAAAISAVLCVLLIAAWIMSPWRSAGLAVFSHNGNANLLLSHRHSLLIGFSDIPFDGRAWSVDAALPSPASAAELADLLSQTAQFKRSWVGFHVQRGVTDTFGFAGRWYTVLVLPLWFAILATAILPVLWTRKASTIWRRKRRGACLNCGYDLRESRDRCPECGAPVPVAPAAIEPTPA